jgi:DNA-binding MarR family transcriptional regulator
MEKRGLISWGREERDRRVVLTRIAAEGLDLLASLDQPVCDTHRRILGHLGAERLAVLRELLELCTSEVREFYYRIYLLKRISWQRI